MNALSRAKSAAGGIPVTVQSVANGGSIYVPEGVSYLEVVGSGGAATTAATAIIAPGGIKPGRLLTIVGTDETNTVTLTNTSAATAEGQYNATANTALANADVLLLVQRTNGAWVRVTLGSNTGA